MEYEDVSLVVSGHYSTTVKSRERALGIDPACFHLRDPSERLRDRLFRFWEVDRTLLCLGDEGAAVARVVVAVA